jgi:hypothetical protein
MHDEDNDGKFPDESPVEVRYPRSKREEQGDRLGGAADLAQPACGCHAPGVGRPGEISAAG